MHYTVRLTTFERRFPWTSTGWTKADFLKAPTDRVADCAKVLAPPLRPKAEEDVAKMVSRARAVIFMVVDIGFYYKI